MVISTLFTSKILLCSFVGVGLFRWKSRKSQNPEHLFIEALKCLVKNDKKNAVSYLRQVVKKDSDHVEAYLLLGNTIRSESPEQAIKIHQSLTVRPGLSKDKIVEIHKALAEDYHIIGRLNDAKREGGKILKLERRNQWAVKLMLEISEKEKDWRQAEKWNHLLIKITGENGQTDRGRFHIYAGIEKIKSGDLNGAESEFNKSVKLSPKLALPYYHLGNLNAKNGRKELALENWKKYLSLTPNPNPDVFKEIESILFELNSYNLLEDVYRNILKIFPNNLEVLVRMVNYLLEVGNTKEASEILDMSTQNSMTIHLLKYKLSLPDELNPSIKNDLDFLIKESLKNTQND